MHCGKCHKTKCVCKIDHEALGKALGFRDTCQPCNGLTHVMGKPVEHTCGKAKSEAKILDAMTMKKDPRSNIRGPDHKHQFVLFNRCVTCGQMREVMPAPDKAEPSRTQKHFATLAAGIDAIYGKSAPATPATLTVDEAEAAIESDARVEEVDLHSVNRKRLRAILEAVQRGGMKLEWERAHEEVLNPGDGGT